MKLRYESLSDGEFLKYLSLDQYDPTMARLIDLAEKAVIWSEISSEPTEVQSTIEGYKKVIDDLHETITLQRDTISSLKRRTIVNLLAEQEEQIAQNLETIKRYRYNLDKVTASEADLRSKLDTWTILAT